MYRNSVDFLVLQDRPHDGTVGRPTEIMMVQAAVGVVLDPTLSIHPDEAQQIINELWRLGFRPKDGAGAMAHTEAIQMHLDDMRKIVGHKLGVEL